jgi:DNA-binding CsgD family transcriptional regulator
MEEDRYRLTEKERAVLSLLAQGHDAKSIATALSLSVNTVHERLREARRKTGASSSRAAARLLADREEPQIFGSKKTGMEDQPRTNQYPELPDRRAPANVEPFPTNWGAPLMISAAILASALIVKAGGFAAPSSRASAPKVIATAPANGALVRPGRITLSVTFDRPMRRQSYSFVQRAAETYPNCGAKRPTQSRDGRTFTLQCLLSPGRRYEVWFNSPPYTNFVSEAGVRAEPYQLLFRSRSD